MEPHPSPTGDIRLSAHSGVALNRAVGLSPIGSRTANHRHILILGIGNTLLGDEGIGVHAMRAVAQCSAHIPNVRCIDGGTLSFSLAPEIEDCAGLIVQDAVELQAPAGEVRVFVGSDMDDFLGSNRKRSVHEVGLLDLMAIAALTGHLPERRALIGIQPEFVGWRDGPSERVSRSIPEACARALELVESWRS